MVLTARPVSLTWLRRARFWALALLALVVAHDAVYLATYGARYADAMAAGGHGYWITFVLLAVVVAGVPLGLGVVTLVRLRAALAGAGAAGVRTYLRAGDGPSYLGELVGLLPRLFLLVVVAFTLQENAESVLAGHGLPGLHALDGGLTIPVLFLVSALVALAGAWLRWRETVLTERLSAARAASARPHRPAAASAPAAWGAIAAIVAHGWLLARRLAGRAPPMGIAHSSRGSRPASLPA